METIQSLKHHCGNLVPTFESTSTINSLQWIV